MLFNKIVLSSALLSVAGLVACGDDSSSNSDSKELPKSVPTFFDLADVECNADRKCETIIVEDGPDTYECDGVSQWNMLINSMPSKICPAEEEKKAEGEEGGDDAGSSDSNGGSTEISTDSQGTSTDSDATSTNSGATSTDSGATSTDSQGTSTDSGATSTDSGDKTDDSSSSKEVTGPTGNLVSCTYTADGVMGGTFCDEVAESMQSGLAGQCDMMAGTMKTDGGCSQENVMKKCPSENMNHYIYNGSNDDTCPTF